MKRILLFLSLFITLMAIAESHNGTVYVKPGGSGTGTSWEDALGDIQSAIGIARSENPEARKDVWVAGGEFEITVAINIIDSVNVYGSFEGIETAVDQRPKVEGGNAWDFVHPTILNGNGARLFQAGGHMDMETVIDGFIMQNGNAIGSALSGSGGAVVARGNVVYQNSIMRNNTAASAGGAAIMTGGTIRHCLIENNTHHTGANGGGGIFSNPPAGQRSYIENSVIRGNSSTIRGAGIGVQGVEMTFVSNVQIYNNIAIDGTTLKPGGGVYSNSSNNRIINAAIYNNTGGTAVYYNGGSMFNSTIVKNVGGVYLAGNVVNMINNIVWGCATDLSGETPTSISGVANTLWTVSNNGTYNPIPTDKGWAIEGNIQFSSNVSNGEVADPNPGTVGSGPRFRKVSNFIGKALEDLQKLNLDSVDWRLNSNSPCVDAGQVVGVVVEDLWLTPRPQGFPVETAKHDIGAYELPYHMVVAGESADAGGFIYSSLGEQLAEGFTWGYADGALLELYFEPKSGAIFRAYYTISLDGGLTFTGEEIDFTNEIDEDGFWSSRVYNSFKVSVLWEAPSSVASLLTSGVRCYGVQNGIQISGMQNSELVQVYNFAGALVHQLKATAENQFIALPRGMYIVQLDKGVQKVIVR